MPAAAVIPAPIAYIKVVAVKKLVVETPAIIRLSGIIKDTVKRGDSFGELMIQNKVDYPKIAKLSEDFRDCLLYTSPSPRD